MAKARFPIHGWLVIDKPYGLGSTQALGKVKWLLKPEKAGHGGTLDPLATGLLPIALGEATKTVNSVMDGRKTYRFAVRWGAETSTDDLEGEIVSTSNLYDSGRDPVDLRREVEAVLPGFIGTVKQRPPAYSAIKVDGERAYDLARAGEVPELAERDVNIYDVKILSWQNGRSSPTPYSRHPREGGDPAISSLYPRLPSGAPAFAGVTENWKEGDAQAETVFEVSCGKGTYVRSLARDIGRATGWLGHVTELRRTAVGPFTEADAISLEKLAEIVHSGPSENSLSGILRPIETVLDGIPALAVMDPDAARLRQGQSVLIRGSQAPVAAEAVLVSHRGQPLGICSIEQGALKPKRLFNL